MWTEEDDKELEYDKWHRFTAKTTRAEYFKVHPLQREIWPNWSDGVPTKLCRQLGSPAFDLGVVKHRYRPHYYDAVDFHWCRSFTLPDLTNNTRLLPEHAGGVYRLFAANKTIDRCCGKDPTGTLYLGCAGTKRNWSNLRTRIKSLVDRDHHAINRVSFSDVKQKVFPWDSLAVQWDMGERKNYKGEPESAAILGETCLLACYHDSFGEYPPWNQKG